MVKSNFSSALFESMVSVCSEGVCGMFSGQKRSPAFAGDFHRQGRGAFFMFPSREVPITFLLGNFSLGV